MQEKSAFLHLKSLSDSHFCQDTADNATVQGNNSTEKYKSQQMTIVFTVPKMEGDTDDDKAALAAIEKINQMIETLVNNLPIVRVGPWSASTATI